MEEVENHHVGCYTKIQALSLLLVVGTVRSLIENQQADYSLSQKTLDDKRRLLMDEYFRGYSKTLRADILAERLGVSVRQLNRIMLKYYSMSFKQKLLSTRIDQAKSLLLTTDLTIAQIATMVGYSSVGYFSKMFKEYTSFTTSQYRANHLHLRIQAHYRKV